MVYLLLPEYQCPVPRSEAQGLSILRADCALSGARYKWEFGKARFDCALMGPYVPLCPLIGKTRARSGRDAYEGFRHVFIGDRPGFPVETHDAGLNGGKGANGECGPLGVHARPGLAEGRLRPLSRRSGGGKRTVKYDALQ